MSDACVCPVCGGTLEDKAIQIDLRHKGKLVIIDGVPAQVCRQCGERLVSGRTSRDIDAVLESSVPPVRTVRVPVLPFRRRAEA